ncbi:MAG: TAXI family TRAP transporter solute-binding subunit [Proteobacteria bacterium]|nr:TAXI family TRAP transporter solute-binding subunit [Pseudomonadota bacterium]
MKRLPLTLLFPVLAIGLVALAPGVAEAQAKKHKQVEFISGSPTGTWFPTAAVVAELTNKHYDGQPISVIPGPGGVGNVLRVGTGQSELGISYGPFLKMGLTGEGGVYKQKFPELRAIASMTPNKLHLVMEKGAGVAELKDLKSKKPKLRISTGPQGSTELFMITEILNYYGVAIRDVEGWGGRVDLHETSARVDAWKNRQAEMVNFFINNPAAQVANLMSGRDAVLVTLEDSVRNVLADKWGLVKYTIPANDYPNQTSPVQTLGMPYVIFSSTRLDDDMVYAMTKEIAQNKTKLESAHSAFKEWQPKDMIEGLGVPPHPGAAKYYKEVGWLK